MKCFAIEGGREETRDKDSSRKGYFRKWMHKPHEIRVTYSIKCVMVNSRLSIDERFVVAKKTKTESSRAKIEKSRCARIITIYVYRAFFFPNHGKKSANYKVIISQHEQRKRYSRVETRFCLRKDSDCRRLGVKSDHVPIKSYINCIILP